LWTLDHVSKKKGQQSGDLLKTVENNSSHDWHLIFLLTLAPNQRWCQDCIRHQPTNLSILLQEVWSILSPAKFQVWNAFPSQIQGSWVLLTFEIKLKVCLNWAFPLFIVHVYLLFIVFVCSEFQWDS
jgi:hypothetical protein